MEYKGKIYPKVSICIPSYNYAHFLSDTIESVLEQTYKNLELIVVDNCSTDNTREIVQEYINIDKRVTYFCNETNIGLVGNLTRCLEKASGEYVKIVCADDLLETHCIEKSVSVLENFPHVTLVTVGRLLVSKEIQPITTLFYSNKFKVIDGIKVIKKCIVHGNLIGEPSAVIFKRKNAKRGFNTNYQQISDLEMWIHLLESGHFASIPEPLCKLRQHELQGTKKNIISLDFADDEFNFLHEYLNKDSIKLSFFEKQYARLNRAHIIWKLRRYITPQKAKEKISEHYGLSLFYSLLPFKYFELVIKTILKAT